MDAFTCACGTGGTLAGVSLALKAQRPDVRIVLADPEGSGLYGWVKIRGPVAAWQLDHGGDRPVPRDGQPQGAVDRRRRAHSRSRRRSSRCSTCCSTRACRSAGPPGVNVAAAIRVARAIGPGHTVVTILCDSGARYQSKLFNPAFLRGKGLPVPAWLA